MTYKNYDIEYNSIYGMLSVNFNGEEITFFNLQEAKDFIDEKENENNSTTPRNT